MQTNWRCLGIIIVALVGTTSLADAGADGFHIQQTFAIVGTATTDGVPVAFEQSGALEYDLWRNLANPDRIEFEVAWQNLGLSFELSGQLHTLQLTPTAMVVDGSTVYNGLQDRDVPSPYLCQLLRENPKAWLNPHSRVLKWPRGGIQDQSFPVIDLKAALEEALVLQPPTPLVVDQQWAESNPLSLLGGLLKADSQQQYRITSAASPSGGEVVFTYQRRTAPANPLTVDLPADSYMPELLRFSIVPRQLDHFPNQLVVKSLHESTQGTVWFDADRNYLTRKSATSSISMMMDLPEAEPAFQRTRMLTLERRVEITAEVLPEPTTNPGD